MSAPSAESPYDLLAPHYGEISRARAAYLEGIERLVIASLPPGTRSLLDVGAGDGTRAVRIARAAGIPTLVLAEPSRAMAEECRRRGASAVWTEPAEALPEGAGPFDAMTCLWNVLGHVPSEAARVEALRRMGGLLSERGILFLDVNHRYNAQAYGLPRTIARLLFDRIRPSERNGDVSVAWRLQDRAVRGVGHVFTRGEMARIAGPSGLRVRSLRFVDYGTGEEVRRAWSGQLLFEFRPAPTAG